VHLAEELPRSASGKLLKRELRERFSPGGTR
jgi:acyl-coenzyme A synthetase/AMP-(fatty) acid ligase